MVPLLKFLQQLNRIEPDRNFAQQSLARIFQTPQRQRARLWNRVQESFYYSGALVLTSFLLFIMFGGLSLLRSSLLSPAMMASLDSQKLNDEFDHLDLQIKVAEVSYYENSLQTVNVALNEASKNAPAHLNNTVIEKEVDGLKQLESRNQDLENLLNELVL